MKRRTLLAASLALPVAACGMVTTGSGAITVNVADLVTWGVAIGNGATLLANLPGVPASVPTALTTLSSKVNADLAAIAAASNGSATLSFASGSVPAAISSLLTDAQTILNLATAASLPASFSSTAQTYILAIQTVVGLIQAAVQTTTKAAALPMTEAKALTVLGVR